ncbi:ABC transporter ATP-binding protein [Bacillaceae bacterium SIJ1]|uniref:ABC transporter ATP-binding protein n=1 Tax=Litoribacterium kuwaitense TaxID=1398745 RepID=UPI0013EC0465|nr:ABC transporter ATP-binding protein [Litoribacterium kuwaitense]NGP46772.1 ABC transporter ATP-binding protein [Litoribacterium kuwaitense]
MFYFGVSSFILINIVLDTAETINGFQLAKLKDKLVGGIKRRIFKKVSEFDDISLFEDPKLLNYLHLAHGNIQKITQLVNVMINLLIGFFTFIPVFILSFSIAWWVPIIIFVTAIPSIYKQLQYEEKTWSVEFSQADLVKQMSINENVLTNETFSKELRQYQLSSFFLDRWNKLFDEAFKQIQDVRKKGTNVILSWSLLSGIGVGIPYIYVVYMAGNGAFSLGDLALFAGLVYQVRRSIFIFVGNLTEVQRIALASSALFDLLNLNRA